MRIVALLGTAVLLSACNPVLKLEYEPDADDNQDVIYTEINDPYGQKEAEFVGGQSARLVDCSKYPTCPEHARALFWVAADILSVAGEATIEAEAIGITPDMKVDEITKMLMGNSDKIFDSSVPDYDLTDAQFQRGLRLMHRAHNSGSTYATNELGLLFLQQEEMMNLDMAAQYFQSAAKNGDSLAMYNLARIAHLRDPNDHSEVLKFLKLAAESGDAGMKTMYAFGLEAFGDSRQKLEAKLHIRRVDDVSRARLRGDFNSDFIIKLNP